MNHLSRRIGKIEAARSWTGLDGKSLRELTDAQLLNLLLETPKTTPIQAWRGTPVSSIPDSVFKATIEHLKSKNRLN